MKARLSKLASSRAFIAFVAILPVLLLLPALRSGFMMDDYGQKVFLSGGPFAEADPIAFWDMFRFQDANRTTFRMSLDRGAWPWWSAPDLQLAFLRPVTAITHAVDHWLFPDSPASMRLESLLMYGGVAAIAGVAYRRFLGATALAGLAMLMYALDDAHAVTTTWIANRNAVLAAGFGLATLVMHDRAVRGGDRRARFVAPALLALGLLSAEAAVGALGYLAAHAVWLHDAPWKARAKALWPYVAVVAAWTLVYKLGGYGAWGGEFYVDPGREPLRFAKALATRLPLLVHGQFGFPPSDLWIIVPEAQQPFVWGAVVVAVLVGAAVLVLGLRRTNENAFFATGMFLSLVPVCAVFPGDRLLLFAGFGAFGMIADFLTAPRDGLTHARKIVVRAAAAGFVLLHVAAAPLMFAGRGVAIAKMLHDPIERAAASLPPSSELADKTLVIVNAPDFLTPAYGLWSRERRGEPLPARMRQLALAVEGRVTLRRTGDKTIEVTASKGFFHEAFAHVFRKADAPVELGQRFEVAGMVATVKAFTSDRAHAGTIEFAFDAPIDGPSFAWVTWVGKRLERFELPKVGDEVDVPVSDYMAAMQ